MSLPPTSHAADPLGAEIYPNGDPRSLLNAEQVAEVLSVPKSWVYAETRAGRLPHVKLGRYYRYSAASISAFVAGLERGPTPYRKYAPTAAPGNGPGGSPHESLIYADYSPSEREREWVEAAFGSVRSTAGVPSPIP